MATRYEYYITGDDNYESARAQYWRAQTFTPSTAHKITSVKLKLFRTLSPGIVTVSIQGVDDNDHPDGSDICSGTTDGDTLTTDTAGEWREITLGAGYNLDADTKYAIVIRALDAPSDNWLRFRTDESTPTYVGGCYEYSNNSGGSWTAVTGTDLMFEDWGEPLWELHEWEGSDGIAIGEALVKTPMKVLVDGIQFSDVTIKEFYKTLTDPFAFTDTLVKYKTMLRTFTDGIAFTDVVSKMMSKVVSDGIAFTDLVCSVFIGKIIRTLTAVRNNVAVRIVSKIRDCWCR